MQHFFPKTHNIPKTYTSRLPAYAKKINFIQAAVPSDCRFWPVLVLYTYFYATDFFELHYLSKLNQYKILNTLKMPLFWQA